MPMASRNHSRRHSGHPVIGRREERRAATAPTTNQTPALETTATNQRPAPPITGIPVIGRVGMATTASTNPGIPRQAESDPINKMAATNEMTAADETDIKGPSRRTSRRWWRGPSGTTTRREIVSMATDQPYGSTRSDASMPSPLLVTAAVVVAAVWWSDVLVSPSDGLDHRLLWSSFTMAMCVVVFAAFRRRHLFLLVLLLLAGVACGRGVVEWSVQSRPVEGRVDGVMRVVEDPEFRGRGVRIVVDDGRDRLEAYAYGSVGRRLSRVSAGEMVEVDGRRRPIDASSSRRRLLRHVTGRIDIERVDLRPSGIDRTGGGLDRAANRVRDSLEHGARVLPSSDRALLLGFLVGDDRFQTWDTISAFRESGLAHLTAVSGQNVAFVLAIVSPLVSRLSRGARVGVTIVVLAWFAVLTRAEPSVVRAVFMAGAATIGSVLEWRRRGLDVLCLAVVLGAIIDPFLVWNVGWWLSIGGCVGLAVIAPHVATSLRSGRLATVVSPTIGAQLGVLPVSVLVFGWPSAWSVPCNVLAGPVAGLAMLIGLPVTLLSSFLPDSLASVVMAPIVSAVRWVDVVARIGARLDVPSWIDGVIAVLVPLGLMVVGRRRNSVRATGVATSAYERSPRSRF